MRQIVLDTETTGLSPAAGDRIIEIGCVELLNRRLTGNNLHLYLNPERESHEDALKVHGLTSEFLQDNHERHNHDNPRDAVIYDASHRASSLLRACVERDELEPVS